jgi:formate dehydrogenase
VTKILGVLYDDPVDGYPRSYARDTIPKIERYPGGQTAPSPKAIDFTPGTLLGSVSGGLGLRKYLEGLGHTFVVTSDKEGENSVFERELPDAEIVISQPFWPAYLTAERIAKAPKLKLAITAGIGSDHVDLQAAIKHQVTVTEVTFSNSISVSDHVVMMILGLVRNYIPSYKWVIDGGWNIADCVARSYDLEAMEVGTVAAGRIGLAVLRRLKTVRRQAALHRPASAVGRDRAGAQCYLSPDGRGDGQGVRRGDDQCPAAPGDRAPVQ